MTRTLAALAVVAVTIAGCSNSATESGSADHAGATKQEKGVKFAECMRENGVADFPDPDAKGEFQYGVSVSPAAFKRAADACKDLQPPGVFSSKRNPEEQKEALTFAECMRENGVKDFPDPVDGQPLVDTRRIPSSDTDSGMTILNAAMEKCGDLADKNAGQ